MSLRAVLRRAVDAVSNDRALEWRRERWLSGQAARVCAVRDNGSPIETFVDAIIADPTFQPDQKRSEIIGLLQRLERNPPRRVLEIGGRRGGTLLMFTAVAAPAGHLLSVDIAYTTSQVAVAHRIGRPGQSVRAHRGNSQDVETFESIRGWLAGEPLDFLFIDGDHSLHGVTRDFAMYGPLLRTGGVVALHDIVPDARTRRGVATQSNAGEVPAFWRELKNQHLPTVDLVEDREQDGFGIGLIQWSPKWAAVAAGMFTAGARLPPHDGR